MKCMICGRRDAKAFGPYREEDLLCEDCATDPRVDRERLLEGIRNTLLLMLVGAIVVWVIYCLAAGGW